jgi:hypothetical protein
LIVFYSLSIFFPFHLLRLSTSPFHFRITFLKYAYAISFLSVNPPYYLSSASIVLHETRYVCEYHGTRAHLNRVLHTFQPSVCVCMCMLLRNGSVMTFPRQIIHTQQ